MLFKTAAKDSEIFLFSIWCCCCEDNFVGWATYMTLCPQTGFLVAYCMANYCDWKETSKCWKT